MMKLSKKQIQKIIRESLIFEAPPGIIGGPGMGGGTAAGEIESEPVKPAEQQQAEYMGGQIPDVVKTLAPMVAELILGFTPAGVAIDAKDLTVAIKQIVTGEVEESEAYQNAGFAMLGFIPFGDIFKGIKKAFKEVPENQIDDIIEQES